MTRLPTHYAAARSSYLGELGGGARDFSRSIGQARLWWVLALNDIASRYRGSILGPFWITLACSAFVAGIGIVYGDLMHVSTEKYVPWMATGVVMWTLISSMIMEGSDAFVQGAEIIRQTSLPLPLFVWRVVARNVINFAHQIVVILGVAIWFRYIMRIDLPMALLGFALVLINIAWISFAAAIISARFRDVHQIITTALQLIFFISPVIWIPNEMSGKTGRLLSLNPVAHMLEVTRNPLIGLPVHHGSLVFIVVLGAVGWAFTFCLYAAVRRRIVHYL